MVVTDELDFLAGVVDLTACARVADVGCGAAALDRDLVTRFPGLRVDACEIDEHQHTRNLAAPAGRIAFHCCGAQSLPFGDGTFDLVVMLKSLHHVAVEDMDAGLTEVARVLRAGGHLYVSEPVYEGELNDIVSLFHDEQVVRARALAAVRGAVASGTFEEIGEHRFDMPVHYHDPADFEHRMLHVSYQERHADDATLAEVRGRLTALATERGIDLLRPMRVNLLRKPE